MIKKDYIFQSSRLGFRNWADNDQRDLTKMNQDPKVMEFFPGLHSQEQSQAFILKMQKQFEDKKHCYFAVDLLDNKTFIGFIGLSWQDYDAYFTPCVDIGWRLLPNHWGYGYATEGAKSCLNYAFKSLKLKKIYAVTPKLNIRSEQVMQKIGMQKQAEFEHPFLAEDSKLKTCLLYAIDSDSRKA